LGATSAVGAHLACLLRGGRPEYLYCLGIFASFAVTALLGAIFRNPRQLDWYGHIMVLPHGLVGTFCSVAAAFGFDQAALWIGLGGLLALALAPIVWLVGALWIRWHPKEPAAC
jgi:hypothetical protein